MESRRVVTNFIRFRLPAFLLTIGIAISIFLGWCLGTMTMSGTSLYLLAVVILPLYAWSSKLYKRYLLLRIDLSNARKEIKKYEQE